MNFYIFAIDKRTTCKYTKFMNTIDIILLLVVLVPGVITGLTKGFVHQIVTLAALWLGALVSAQFSAPVASFIQSIVSLPGNTARIVAFVLIFIIAYIVLRILGALVKKIAKDIAGGGIDKLLGVILGVAKMALIIGLAVLLFDYLNDTLEIVDKKTTADSKAFNCLKEFARVVFPYIKNLVTQGAA